MSRPILITGASGFAGSHLVELLGNGPAPVIATSRAAEPRPGPAAAAGLARPGADGGVVWKDLDVMDAGAVRAIVAEHRPAAIYHCAGAAHVGSSWKDATRTHELNVMGTEHVLEALRRERCGARVLIPGSALVYRRSDRAMDEDHPVGPSSPYGISKLAQELLGAAAAREDHLEVLLARSFNHLGPRQNTGFAASSFARQIARIEAGQAEPVLKVGNLESRRDVMDVRDTVRAYRAIVERGRPGRIYNVCSGRAHRIGDLLDLLLGMARVGVRLKQDPTRLRPSDTPFVLGNPRRIQAELGWRPEIPIERTLQDLLDYWRQALGAGS